MNKAEAGREQINNAIINFPNYLSDEIDLTPFMDDEQTRKICRASDFKDKLIGLLTRGGESGLKMPWEGLAGRFECRQSELTIWAGAKGHGKSLVISQVLETFITKGQKVFIISPEFPPHRVLHRMLIQSFGVHESRSIPLANQWIDAVSDSLWLYDQQKSMSPQDIPALCRYAVKRLGVQHILIDSLMKCGVGSDDYNGQKKLVDSIQQVAHNSEVHIHLVAHSKKGSSDDKIGGLHDVKGASEIADMAENVIFVWRNKAKELGGGKLDEPDCVVKVESQRNADGWIGLVPLWFNRSNFTFREG